MKQLKYVVEVYASLFLILGVLVAIGCMMPKFFVSANTIEQSLTQTIKR